MKKRPFLFAIAAAVLLASCVKDLNTDCSVEVKFTGNTAKFQTRVSGTDGTIWDANDPVGIYMIKAAGSLTAADILPGGNNRRYTASAGATANFTVASGAPITYPEDGSSVKFIAYHPYSAGVTADFKLPVDLSDQTDQSAIDVLYAPATAASSRTTATPVALNFSHKLVKLVFKISNDASITEPVANGITVSISEQQTEGAMNLANGTVTPNADTPVAIEVESTTSGTQVTAEAIVFAGSTADVVLTFTNGAGRSFSVAVPHATWDGGYRYTYTVTLGNSKTTIGGSINPWEDDGDDL
jgi:hypothetical protein